MKSVYYYFSGSTYNMKPIVIANPYKHLTVLNYSPNDIYLYNEKNVFAFIPAETSLTLLDVFSQKNSIDEKVDTAIYIKTIPEDSDAIVHLINYGV